MSTLGINNALADMYQYSGKTQKTDAGRTCFAGQLQNTQGAADTSKVESYTSEKDGRKSFEVNNNQNMEDGTKVLGIGFLHAGGNWSYGMRAVYGENSTSGNPIIKVLVTKGMGNVEEYDVNINKVNARNATEIEMFALCSYADANGSGTGGTFGSWQTLNYYRHNANHLDRFEMTNTIDKFTLLKQDWTAMVQSMIIEYRNGGLYKQVLDGNKLLKSVLTTIQGEANTK